MRSSVPLTEEVRTNISQYLGVDKNKFQNFSFVLTEDWDVPISGSREMILRPQKKFASQIPYLWVIYPTSDVKVINGYHGASHSPHTAATPHTDFDIGAYVNIDARVFSFSHGQGQVADLVRYDRAYVNYYTMLYTTCDADGHSLSNSIKWTCGISPDNCRLGFQSDRQSRAVLSFCDYNGGPVGMLNGRAATDLTPVSNALTLI
jgi:hypothetical protein